MPISYSPLFGPFILTRVMAHFFILTGLLAYQFLFRDFVNPLTSVFLYLVCATICLVDGVYVSLPSKYHQNKVLPLFLFFLDSAFLLCLIVSLGSIGLYPAFLVSLFLFFAFRLYGSWWGLGCFALGISGVFFAALLWQGGFNSDERIFLALVINFILFANCLAGGFIGQLLKDSYEQVTALKERSFFDPDQVDRPPSRLELALNLSRKIKPVLTSLRRVISGTTVFQEDFVKAPSQKQEKESVPDKMQLKQCERQVKQFQKFVDDFIEFAEPEKLVLKALDFNHLIQKTLKEILSHPERPKDLKKRVELRSSGCINGSPAHLKGALTQILINAFQAMKIQSKPLIKVINYDERGWLILEISDNGQGMEEGDIRQAFEPLFSKRLGIRGMGLALAFKVVKSHGGSIFLNSEFQKGTQVKIKLPLISIKYSRKEQLSA